MAVEYGSSLEVQFGVSCLETVKPPTPSFITTKRMLAATFSAMLKANHIISSRVSPKPISAI